MIDSNHMKLGAPKREGIAYQQTGVYVNRETGGRQQNTYWMKQATSFSPSLKYVMLYRVSQNSCLRFRSDVGKPFRFFRKIQTGIVQTMLIELQKFIAVAAAFWPKDVKVAVLFASLMSTENG